MTTNPIALIRAALSGRTLLVVGGDPRPAALLRLKDAFALTDVLHAPTRKSDPSPGTFRFRLLAPSIALVIRATGLTRTAHGASLHQHCRELGIPYVDCFRFPHPNLLATRILDLHLLGTLERRGLHSKSSATLQSARQGCGGVS